VGAIQESQLLSLTQAVCACIHFSLHGAFRIMPRKPSYDFDRRRKEQERKTKTDKKRAERQQRRDEQRVEDAPPPESPDEK
jgi:hypothetical protein